MSYRLFLGNKRTTAASTTATALVAAATGAAIRPQRKNRLFMLIS